MDPSPKPNKPAQKKGEAASPLDNLVFSLDEWITTSTDEELIRLKRNGSKLSAETEQKIREKKEQEVFKFVQKELEKTFVEMDAFFQCLKVDDVKLFEKLKLSLAKQDINIEKDNLTDFLDKKFKEIKTDKDLKNAIKSPFDQEDLKRLVEIGRNWSDAQEDHKALPYFQYLVSLNPKEADYWLFKGITEQNLGRYKDAIISYNMVTELKSEYFLPYLLMIECLIGDNHVEEARDYFKQILKAVPIETFSEDEMYKSKIDFLKKTLI